MNGTEFVREAQRFPSNAEGRADLEEWIESVAADWTVKWPMYPVMAKKGVTFYAGLDYFSIGTPTDFVRVPVSGTLAQQLCDRFGWIVPTTMMTDLVWRQSDLKLSPLPWGPPYDSSMMSVERFVSHHYRIEEQIERASANQAAAGLISGHKKDVVLSGRMAAEPKSVAIYGWHRLNGTPIQGPTASLRHELSYRDYSHGLRPIASMMDWEGKKVPVAEVLQDPQRCRWLVHEMMLDGRFDEGPLRVVRYPTAQQSAMPKDVVLRRNDRGARVRAWQEFLLSHGHDLGRWGADGVFGGLTEAATKTEQAASGLPATGVVDVRTYRLMLKATIDESIVDAVPGAPTLPSHIPFMPARNFTSIPGNDVTRQIDLIVIHTMEAHEKPDTAENVAAWAAGTNAPRASWHFAIDMDSIVQCVKDKDVAWHAPGANHNGLGFEHAGFAKQTDPEWRDEYSTRMLRLSAALCADRCEKYSIPIRFVDADGLRRGERGVTTHAEVTEAFRKSNHWDPGKYFPMDRYLSWVRATA